MSQEILLFKYRKENAFMKVYKYIFPFTLNFNEIIKKIVKRTFEFINGILIID